MIEGKRQKQVGSVIQKELNEIFQRLGLNMIDGGMVSIADVKITPDLLEARIYLSLFQVKDNKAAMKKVEERQHDIKRDLAVRVKHQLRRIPELRFFIDDTLDHVFRMEELFRQIQDEKKANDQKDTPD